MRYIHSEESLQIPENGEDPYTLPSILFRDLEMMFRDSQDTAGTMKLITAAGIKTSGRQPYPD